VVPQSSVPHILLPQPQVTQTWLMQD